MKAKLADRSLFQPSSSALTPDSRFPDLVAYWLEGLDLEDRLSITGASPSIRIAGTIVSHRGEPLGTPSKMPKVRSRAASTIG